MVLTDQLGPCAGIPVDAAADNLGPVDFQGSYLPASKSACFSTAGTLAQRASGAAGRDCGRSRLPRPALRTARGVDAAPRRFRRHPQPPGAPRNPCLILGLERRVFVVGA